MNFYSVWVLNIVNQSKEIDLPVPNLKIKQLASKKFILTSQLPMVVILLLGLLFFFSPTIATWHYEKTARQSILGVDDVSEQQAVKRLDYSFAIQTQLFQILGGIAVLTGIWVTWRRARVAEKTLEVTNRNLAITEAGHFIERFTKAIEHLGSKETAV